MFVYLPGPQGPDQLATKWLLMERGYSVKCATDVATEDGDLHPNLFRQRQMREMLRCDAVVLEDAMMDDGAAVLDLLHVCRYTGVVVLLYDELPAQVPSAVRLEEILYERNLLRPEGEFVALKTRLRNQVKAARARVERWARRFDEKYGWFFTNGNKMAQRAPRPYALPDEQPLTTTR